MFRCLELQQNIAILVKRIEAVFIRLRNALLRYTHYCIVNNKRIFETGQQGSKVHQQLP